MITSDPARFRQGIHSPTTSELQQLHVIATTPEGTRAALEEADRLSRRLPCGRIVLLAPQVVSSLGSVGSPEEDAALIETYKRIAAGLDVVVRLCVCRTIREVSTWMVPRGSVVVVGGSLRWWWPTREQRMAVRLRRAGHRVLFVSVSAPAPSEEEHTRTAAREELT